MSVDDTLIKKAKLILVKQALDLRDLAAAGGGGVLGYLGGDYSTADSLDQEERRNSKLKGALGGAATGVAIDRIGRLISEHAAKGSESAQALQNLASKAPVISSLPLLAAPAVAGYFLGSTKMPRISN